MSTKKSPPKAAAKKPTPKKAAPKKAVKKAVEKAVTKAKTLKPKPKATRPAKKDVGIFGAIQKNIQEGITVITETLLPSPKRSSRKR